MRKTGNYITIGHLNHFIPDPLPPKNPTFELSPEIITLYGEANFALGQLNEMSLRLPNSERFIKAYVIKEALLSSEIEGIHTTLIDVFTSSTTESHRNKETQLVLNYTQALNTTRALLRDGIPLTSRIISQAHKVLMSSGEGDRATPGLYRKQAVRVGHLIPPPAHEVPNLMSDLEKYIHEKSSLPSLIKTGLVHVQFETIHPFLDGNGRIGRLLIVLMLIESGHLATPILYPSYYFKKHHTEYYHQLDRVRVYGDFESWITYYLQAIKESSLDAHRRAQDIESLEKELRKKLHNNYLFSRTQGTAEAILDFLFIKPVATISEISKELDKSYNTISSIIKNFIEENIVSEITSNKRNKLYRFDAYLHLLEKEY